MNLTVNIRQEKVCKVTLFFCCLCDRVSRREHGDPQIEELNIGEASEQEGRGTGECSSIDGPPGGARAPLRIHFKRCNGSKKKVLHN